MSDSDDGQAPLLELQQDYIDRIKKIEVNFKKDGKRRTLLSVTNRLDSLQDIWTSFVSNHKDILCGSDKDRSHVYFSEDHFDATSEHVLKIKELLQTAVAELQPANNASTTIPSVSTANQGNEFNLQQLLTYQQRYQNEVRLPHINIPNFSGSYYTWTPFYDLFRSLIHDKTTLSGVQKFHYLKTHLSGEAKSLVDHLQITDANYPTAWKALVDRYQNSRLLINSHIHSLMSQPFSKSESSADIKKLLDKTKECLNSLTNLGVDITSWDPIILYLITQRLDSETQRLWEHSLKDPREMPTLADMNKFLETRFQSLEMIHYSSHQFDSNTSPRDTLNDWSHEKQQPQPQQTSSYTTAVCSYCNASDHSTFKCSQFHQMTAENRLKWAHQVSRCTNCLRMGHNSYSCPSKNRCSICKKNHHSMLHLNKTFDTTTSKTCNMSCQSAYPQFQAPNTSYQDPNYNPTYSNPFSRPNNFNAYESHSTHPAPKSSQDSTIPPSSHTPATPNNNSSPLPTTVQPPSKSQPNIQSHCVNIPQHSHSTSILLATAMVKVPDVFGHMHMLRALIDQGSEMSFITESAVQRLQLKRSSTSMFITGICNMQSAASKQTVFNLNSTYDPTFSSNVTALIVPQITNLLPSESTPCDWQHIQHIKLADPNFNCPGKIDILLGAEMYGDIIMEGLLKSPNRSSAPIAQQTSLGWVLTGKTNHPTKSVLTQSFHIHNNATIEQMLQRFWEIEEPPNINKFTNDELMCEADYEQSHYRNADGTYTVSLPFKATHAPLGRSRDRAVARLISMEKTFKKNPNLCIQYKEFIHEYLHLNKAEFTRAPIHNEEHYYMPHQAVIRESSSTTKLRVVFDASSKTSSGESLNDQLMKGPTIQRDLISILLKWRKHAIVITADVEKMYRQIRINPNNYNHQRILWRDSPDTPIQDIILKTVTYGTSSAPYLAIKTLHTLAHDEQHTYPRASRVVLTDFYVDDLMSGGESEEEVTQLYHDLCDLLKRGGFNLRKWTSNSTRVLKEIPEEKREMSMTFEINPTETLKTLGIHWNPQTDQFVFNLQFDNDFAQPTKRSMLSVAAKLFDPLGWIAPIVIIIKVMIQKLWIAGVSWDETVPDIICKEWASIIDELPCISNIRISRWIYNLRRQSQIELHGFCDSSNQAYAAVIYARVIDENGVVSISLITSKTRVAPLKLVSIPRLELCAAVLLSNLMQKTIDGMELQDTQITLWSDSEIVLAWIKNDPHKYKPFVANRIAEIQNNQHSTHWHYVPSTENPADCATRGVKPTQLINHPLWWTGPQWLSREKSSWPIPTQDDRTLSEQEQRAVHSLHAARPANNNVFIERYSSLTALQRSMAYVLRFIHNLRSPKCRRIGRLIVEEINIAHINLIKSTQASEFWTEIQCLRNKTKVPKSSKIIVFNPFLDHQSILRVGGRLLNSNIDAKTKHPIILPPNQHYTSLIINNAHRLSLHGGAQLTLSLTRQEYWIINGRNTVRREIFKCVTCHRFRKNDTPQLMGNLPFARTTPSRPFTHVGVDFAGPVSLRMSKGRGNKTYKGYISVFVCLCTKAIHLEVVTDLSSEAFIAALRRFIGRRGSCSDIYSDNATNFVGADRLLKAEQKQIIASFNAHVSNAVAKNGIQWHFIPPASPNFGGLWEAGVKSVKTHLKRILGETTLTYEEFTTTLIQIEACLNSRPLYPLTEDPDDLEVLTPGHFLIGTALLSPPQRDLTDTSIGCLKRWQLTTKLYQQFWKRWHMDYIHTLQQRPKKYSTVNTQPKVNDLVIIKEDNTPPQKWNIGRIISIHPGSDSITRVVTVKTATSVLKRPTSKISILPILENSNNNN